MESRFREPPRKTKIGSKNRVFEKIEGGMKSRLIYKVFFLLFFDNQESKQKYYGALVQFFGFHLSGHTLVFYSTQKLEPPCTA